jgi:hypothetical protein
MVALQSMISQEVTSRRFMLGEPYWYRSTAVGFAEMSRKPCQTRQHFFNAFIKRG